MSFGEYLFLQGGDQEMTLGGPRHDYIERNEIFMPRIQKKDLEDSGIHQNKAEHERRWAQGAQRGRPPWPLHQLGAISWILL